MNIKEHATIFRWYQNYPFLEDWAPKSFAFGSPVPSMCLHCKATQKLQLFNWIKVLNIPFYKVFQVDSEVACLQKFIMDTSSQFYIY